MTATEWVESYKRAWVSNEPDDIRALFTEDANYADSPHEKIAVRGHDKIVANWLEGRDGPGDWTFKYWVVSESDALAFVQGVTDYSASRGPVYDNLWVIRFGTDGRANDFVEWYMKRE